MNSNTDTLASLTSKIESQITNTAQTLQTYENNQTQDIQREILLNLYNLRNTFNDELASLGNVAVAANQAGGNNSLDDLEKENQKLKYRIAHLERNLRTLLYDDKEKENLRKENEKLKYRINILLRNLEK